MSNFGKEQLLKYGWTEGKGLGKNEDGIPQAIKPTLKFNNAGIGYRETSNDNWWQAHFDNAAKNIKIESHDGQVSLSVIRDNQNTTLPKTDEKNSSYPKGINLVKAASSDDSSHQYGDMSSISVSPASTLLTDEHLYEACRGRTVHKTARHSFTLNGKLERIEQQDSMFMGIFPNYPTNASISTSISQYDIFKTNYDLNGFELTNDFSKRKQIALLNDKKDDSENMNKLSQKLSNCVLKEDDAKSKTESLRHKRKANQDCVTRIDPLKMEDIYVFKKKRKTLPTISSCLRELVRKFKIDQEQTPFEQIQMGIEKMNLNNTEKQIEQKLINPCQVTKIMRQLARRRGYLGSRVQCLKFAYMWIDLAQKESLRKELGVCYYWLIKEMLDVNKHLDLPSNLEKCMMEHPWVELKLRKLYFATKEKQKLKKIKKKRKAKN